METLSGAEVLLVMNDPTNPDVWSCLVRKDMPLGDYPRSPIHVVRSVLVEEPPAFAAHPEEPIDPGLTVEETLALAHALSNDPNPKHLFGFARSCMPDFPVVASLLDAKGRVVALRKHHEPLDAKGLATLEALKLASTPLGQDVVRMWERLGGNLAELHEWKAPARKKSAPKPVSTSALQLAHAARRPELSGVINPDALEERLKSIGTSANDGDAKGKEAQEALIRANKALERRQWVEWYRRILDAESQDRTEQGCLTRPF
jgi:hypothetical protein